MRLSFFRLSAARSTRTLVLVGLVTLSVTGQMLHAQATSISGAGLVLRSLGPGAGNTLGTVGYLGTYLVVPAGGATVNFDVNATGSGGHMNVVVADAKFGFNLAGAAATNYATPNVTLPGGTYLIRAERDYGDGLALGPAQSFSVNNLKVNTVSGTAARFSNLASTGSTAAAASANAMNAANTYINNYRKGALDLSVQGIAPGTAVQVRLKGSGFKWGTAVPDDLRTYLAPSPAVGSFADKYQQRLLANFDSVTPENGGKWSETDDAYGYAGNDRLLDFAAANGMRVRQHNLIWGTQQPYRLDPAFANAHSDNPATAASGKLAIQQAIDARIAAYVGGVNPSTGPGDVPTVRAKQYGDLDVYNESYHTGAAAPVDQYYNYWKTLGPTEDDGAAVTAGIYNRVHDAVAAAGAGTRLFMNEYGVLSYENDQYGQFYSQHIADVRRAGGNVGGAGIQYYVNPEVDTGYGSVEPARAYASLANVSTQGLPMELTEFGTAPGPDAAHALTTAMTLAFGTPGMTGFTMWGFYDTGPDMFEYARGTVLYDANFNLTASGAAYQALRAQWTTNVTTTLAADGSIALPNGAFYGDYEVVIRGQAYDLTYDKGTNRLLLVVRRGDVNNDEVVNAADIDALLAATNGPTDGPSPAAQLRYDLNRDGRVLTTPDAPGSDADELIRAILGSEYGDANLDGAVDFQDLLELAQNYDRLTNAGWADASFNGDGVVNFDDLLTVSRNYEGIGVTTATGAAAFAADWALARSLVPEPTAVAGLATLLVATRRTRRTS